MPSEARIAAAHRAVDARDHAALAHELEAAPDLLGVRIGRNRNELLGMATATGDRRLVALLLEHGADPAAANRHGWTALHQAAYANDPALARTLLDAGAPVRAAARGAGGTPLVVALFWGHPVAELLADHGLHPLNLRVAAGLGRADLVADRSIAGRGRDFHRPHSGFPEWVPSDDPQEVVDEALSWAARSGREQVLEPLVARGARVDADVYRGTALAWAAACGRAGAVERLVSLGADPDRLSTFGGPDHGEGVTALHLAAQNGHVPAVRALLAAGADPTIRDGCHGGTPADWARFGEQPAVVPLLKG